jgi:hypothetical protein
MRLSGFVLKTGHDKVGSESSLCQILLSSFMSPLFQFSCKQSPHSCHSYCCIHSRLYFSLSLHLLFLVFSSSANHLLYPLLLSQPSMIRTYLFISPTILATALSLSSPQLCNSTVVLSKPTTAQLLLPSRMVVTSSQEFALTNGLHREAFCLVRTTIARVCHRHDVLLTISYQVRLCFSFWFHVGQSTKPSQHLF